VENLTRAIKLDPANDRYHFFLASLYARQARANKNESKKWITFAMDEIREAIRINPYDEGYEVYRDWLTNIKTP